MKKSCEKKKHRLLCYGLVLTMVFTPAFSVFAAEENGEEQNSEVTAATESTTAETPQVQPEPSSDSIETNAPDTASTESPEASGGETQEASPAQAKETGGEPETTETDEEAETVEADAAKAIEKTEQQANEDPAPAEAGPSVSVPASDTGLKSAAGSSSPESIKIGDTTFSSDGDESSHWSDGKGWKNVAGQYVAMVDFDGSDAEISADGGVVTLAVAGVNRIGTLKGNCSFRIAGTGIVLIDKIEIEDGNTITLHPNSSVYKEGSAAVFVKQEEDGSYLLINGDVTGILDDRYTLDDVELVVPDGSTLEVGVLAARTELWDNEDGEVTDVTLYTTNLPSDANQPVHWGGIVDIEGYIGSVVLGKNSSLTIDKGASVQLKKIQAGLSYFEAELVVEGALNVLGVLEGGFTSINNGGSVTGDGTVRTANIDLNPGGTISKNTLLEYSGLSIIGNNRSIVPPRLKDSIIYLKGSRINIPELTVSGKSRIGLRTTEDLSYYDACRIGDITLSPGSVLEILCNDHPYVTDSNLESRYVEDGYLEIYGSIVGGAVNVLGGFVEYTGSNADNLPSVPYGYASRVYINGIDMISSEFPLNMTDKDAASRFKRDTIPVMKLDILDALDPNKDLEDEFIPNQFLAREWKVLQYEDLAPLDRDTDDTYTCESFMEAYNLKGHSSYATFYSAVEIIDSQLQRRLYFFDDPMDFNINNAIMIRILDCTGQGGQGGATVTHTSSSITGSGVIGGPGSGSVKAGNGKVVYGKASYIEPDPDPVPDPDPAPEPDKKENEGENNNSSNNNNNNSNNSNNNNSNSNTDNKKESNNKVIRTNTVKASAGNAAELIVTVSLNETSTEAASEVNTEAPQIWHLDVTYAGTPVTDLNGNSVRASFPFTVPESWGDPAGIAGNNLYAVFADENDTLTAYNAQYDTGTGEISFEAEQTGDFVIVQFKYEDEPFTEDFYRELAETEEIKAFLAALHDERE